MESLRPYNPISRHDHDDLLRKHAQICTGVARDMLIAEGATTAEIDAIMLSPDAWVGANWQAFAALGDDRNEIKDDYDPLNDKNLEKSMRAFNGRAAQHTITAISHLRYFERASQQGDALTASASIALAWNLLYVASTELMAGGRSFAVKQAPRIVARNSKLAQQAKTAKFAARFRELAMSKNKAAPILADEFDMTVESARKKLQRLE